MRVLSCANWSCEYRRTCGGRDPRPSAIRRVPALRTGNLPCLRCGDFGARLGDLGCPRSALPPAPGPSERPTRGRCVSDHSHLACDHSHATITDSRRESGSFNTESPYPMRAAPQGPTWWPPVSGDPFLIHRRASNKIAQAEQLPHLLINDGAHDECGHEAQAVDAPTSIEAEWAICAPNVSDALQRACR